MTIVRNEPIWLPPTGDALSRFRDKLGPVGPTAAPGERLSGFDAKACWRSGKSRGFRCVRVDSRGGSYSGALLVFFGIW